VSKGLPYFCWYPADAETDENFRMMSYEERGLYLTALNHAWLNDGLPIQPEELRSLFGMKARLDKLWPRVGRCFLEIDGRLRNPRQEQERATAMLKSSKARASADARWMRPHCEGNARASVSDSDSDSDSDSGSEKSKKVKIENYEGQIDDFDEFWPEYWRKTAKQEAWKAYRKHVTSHETHLRVMAAINQQRGAMNSRDSEHRPHASTWLNQHRWEDDPAAYVPSSKGIRESVLDEMRREAKS
jgi:uncharacterized protein YdaU (DUF1376 family)